MEVVSNVTAPAKKHATDGALYTALLIKDKAVYIASSVAYFWAGVLILLIAFRAETALLYQFSIFFLLVGQTVRKKNGRTNRPSYSNS